MEFYYYVSLLTPPQPLILIKMKTNGQRDKTHSRSEEIQIRDSSLDKWRWNYPINLLCESLFWQLVSGS